jgi:voltage-gated potassium channel Kch
MPKKFRIIYRESIRPFFIDNKGILLFIVGIITIILGYQGFEIAYKANDIPFTSWDLLYETAQLFTLNSGSEFSPGQPWQLNVARYLAPISTLATIVVIIFTAFYKQFNYLWLRGITRKHIIICGAGYVGRALTDHLLGKGYKVVIIEKDPTSRELESCWEKGAIVLVGDASEEQVLRKAQVHKARCLFSVTGSDQTNSKIALLARDLTMNGTGSLSLLDRITGIRNITREREPLNCYVHIVNPTLANFLKVEQMAATKTNTYRLEFFSIYQGAGHCLLSLYPPFKEDQPVPPDAHVLIIGLGRMGESLVIHTVKRWREQYGKTGKTIRITCFDRQAGEKIAKLHLRYPSLPLYCDLIPVSIEFDTTELQNGKFLADSAGSGQKITSIYLCLADESRGLSIALLFHQLLNNPDVPIVIRTVSDEGFARLFNDLNKNTLEFRNLRVFPLVACDCCMDLVVHGMHELIARAIHNEYLVLQKKVGITADQHPSVVPWKDLPPHLKESNRRQADHIWTKLEKINCGIMLLADWEEPLFEFNPSEIEYLAQEEHLRWMEEKRFSNDPAQAQHPSLAAWNNLSEDEKEKDRNAARSIPKILATVDLKVVRFGQVVLNPKDTPV